MLESPGYYYQRMFLIWERWYGSAAGLKVKGNFLRLRKDAKLICAVLLVASRVGRCSEGYVWLQSGTFHYFIERFVMSSESNRLLAARLLPSAESLLCTAALLHVSMARLPVALMRRFLERAECSPPFAPRG